MPTHACARVPAWHTLKHTDAAFKSMRVDDGWSSSITDWGGYRTMGRPFKINCGVCVCLCCVVFVSFVSFVSRLFVCLCVLCVLCVFATQHTHTHTHTQHTNTQHTHTHTHQVRASRVFWSYHYYYYYSRTTACQPARPPARPYSIVPHAELRNFVVGVWFFAISNALSLEYGPLAWWDLLIIQNSAAK